MDHLVPARAFLKAASEIGLPLLWRNLAKVLPFQELNAEQVGPVDREIFAVEKPVHQGGALAGRFVGKEFSGLAGSRDDTRKIEVGPAKELGIITQAGEGAARAPCDVGINNSRELSISGGKGQVRE